MNCQKEGISTISPALSDTSIIHATNNLSKSNQKLYFQTLYSRI